MGHKRWMIGLAIGGLLAGGVSSAWAHSTLDKKSVPADTDVDITVNAPVEEVNAYNQKIILEVPDGFRVLSCGAVEGFACAQSSATGPTRTLLTWERTRPGQRIPFVTDHFPFRMRTVVTPGKYRFDINQFYSNGTVAHWEDPENGDRPAPVLTVTAVGTPAVTNTTAAAHDGSPASPSTTAASRPIEARATTTAAIETVEPETTTSAALPTTTTAALTLAVGADDDSAAGIPLVGVTVGLVAVSGLGAGILRRRRRGAVS